MTQAGLSLLYLERSDPDEDLLESLRRSEPSAVAAAYDAHCGAVRGFATRLVGDPHGAEDLVHEVFLILPKAIKRFRGDSSLRTFLISIAVNHARHHVRGAVRRRKAMDRLAAEPEPTCGSDPEKDARRKELAQALTRALDKLPVDQRVAFVLCEVEERTSVEVASIVGAPEATVRTRLHHAKKKLRAQLTREGVR